MRRERGDEVKVKLGSGKRMKIKQVWKQDREGKVHGRLDCIGFGTQ